MRPDSFTVLSKNSNSEMSYYFAEQSKSNVLSKDRTTLENRPSKTLVEWYFGCTLYTNNGTITVFAGQPANQILSRY